MGALIAKFRKEKSTYEILEKLEFDIKSIEDYSQSTERQRRSIIRNIVISSVGIYVAGAALIYQYFLPQSWSEQLIYVVVPLLVFPLMIFAFKKFVAWYYDKKISKNASKLMALREKKRKILDEVMEKKTYKEAQKILERFDEKPASKKLALPVAVSTPKPPSEKAIKSVSVPSTQLAQKVIGALINSSTPRLSNTSNVLSLTSTPSHRPLPRPLISFNRSFLDKMVDYIIGDGPSTRYALICINCHNHNGMAFEEEFQYLAFRCAFCATFNPARKQRPIAPAFEGDESKESNSEASDFDTEEKYTTTIHEATTSGNESTESKTIEQKSET